MSVQALSWVLDHSAASGTDRLVLIAIANHASKVPGAGAWEGYPGVQTITREAGLTRSRTTQEALARLVESGQVERVVNGAPDLRIRVDRRPNLYRIVMAKGVDCGDSDCAWCFANGVTPNGIPSFERGDAPAVRGVTRERGAGCSSASPEPKRTIIKPLSEGAHAEATPPNVSASHSTKGYIAKYVGWFEEAHGTRPWKSYIDRLAKQLSTSEAKECTTAEIENAVYCIAKEGKRPHVLLDVIGDYRREVAS